MRSSRDLSGGFGRSVTVSYLIRAPGISIGKSAPKTSDAVRNPENWFANRDGSYKGSRAHGRHNNLPSLGNTTSVCIDGVGLSVWVCLSNACILHKKHNWFTSNTKNGKSRHVLNRGVLHARAGRARSSHSLRIKALRGYGITRWGWRWRCKFKKW